MNYKIMWIVLMGLITYGDYYLLPILFRHGSSSAFEIGIAISVFTLAGWAYAILNALERKK